MHTYLKFIAWEANYQRWMRLPYSGGYEPFDERTGRRVWWACERPIQTQG